MEPVSTATYLAVTSAITVGSKLYDYFSGKNAAKEAKKKLEGKKSQLMAGKTGINRSFEGEMGLADDRSESALKTLTTMTSGKLEDMKAKENTRVATLAGSGSAERDIVKSEKSVWDSYMSQRDDIAEKSEDMKITAYGRMSQGVGSVEGQYDELISDIDALGV
jgi:hypothetical protein